MAFGRNELTPPSVSPDRVRVSTMVTREVYNVIRLLTEDVGMTESALFRAAINEFLDMPPPLEDERLSKQLSRHHIMALTPAQRKAAKADRRTRREEEKREILDQLRARRG